MMLLAELPRVKAALDMLGMDNGANVRDRVVIPLEWEMRAQLAEDELLGLSVEETEELVYGEETEQRVVAKAAPNADEILNAAFDGGELAELLFEPWRNIFDAREAEQHQTLTPISRASRSAADEETR
jgi:hypothetical protein